MKRIFRRTAGVTLKTAGGEVVQGKGIICAMNRDTSEIGGLWHPMGELPRPLYLFIGYFPDVNALTDGVLTQGAKHYRVLHAREVSTGEHTLCLRALLERRDGDDHS